MSASHLLFSLFAIVNLDEAWREAKSQLGVLGEYLLVHASIVLQHEGVVGIGYEKDIIDPLEHEVHKGCIFQRHGSK